MSRPADDKRSLLAATVASLEVARDAMAHAAEETRKGATHPEMRAEDPKDMRSTEQSYLARGQAMRVEELEEQIARLRHVALRAFGADDPIDAGALVDVESDEGTRTFFVLPYGGGVEVTDGATTATVVTGSSPVGQALLGRTEGEGFELRVGRKLRDYEIVRVR